MNDPIKPELRKHILDKIEADWRIVQEGGLPERVWIAEYEVLGSEDWPYFEEKGFVQVWRLDENGLSDSTLKEFLDERDRFRGSQQPSERLFQAGLASFGKHKQNGFVFIAYTWGVRYASGWKCKVENNAIVEQKMTWIS